MALRAGEAVAVVDGSVGRAQVRRAAAPRITLGRLVVVVWLLALTVGLWAALGATSTTAAIRSTALLATVVALLPGALMASGEHRESVPLLPLNGTFYAASFALPAFFEPRVPFMVSNDGLLSALRHVCLGLIALYAGYYLVSRFVLAQVGAVRFPYRVTQRRLIRTALLLEGLYLAWRFILAGRGVTFPTLDQALPLLGVFGKTLLLESLLRGELSRWPTVLFLGVALPVEVAGGIASGTLAQPMTTILIGGLVYFRVRRRIPLTVLAVILGLFVLLNPVKNEFRARTWHPSATDSTLSRVFLFLDLARSFHAAADADQIVASLRSVMGRLDQVSMFSFVIDKTPRVVPFARGTTIFPVLYWWIPRAIWPGKPRITIGNDWGHTYRLLDPNDDMTSINLPWLVELYMNFGSTGVLLGMLAIGVAFRLLVRMLCPEPPHRVEFAIAVSVLLTVWWAESNISTTLGGLATHALALYLVARFLLRPRPATRVNPRLVGSPARPA